MSGDKDILHQNGQKDNGLDTAHLSQNRGQVREHKPSYRINSEKLRTLVENLIESRGGRIYEKDGGGWAWIVCPFHDDHNPSLKISLQTGHFHCVACGETGSFVKLWQALTGLGEDQEGRRQAVQTLKGLGVLTEGKPELEATYFYYSHDENARLVFRKRKFRRYDGSKYFVIDHYDFENDVWKAGKPKDCPPVLYNYHHALIEARYNGGTLYFVEGEKDVETLKLLGFLATTTGGANDWKTELAGEFAGLEVVIIPDNDPAGKELMVKVGTDILPFASSVHWVDLAEEAKRLGIDFPEKGDITDFLELAKQKGLDPVKVVESFTHLEFNPKELQERADKELLLSSGVFLTKEVLVNFSGVEFLFEGFLPWGYAVVLSSEPGAGKSRLSLALAKEAVKRGVKVVYLDGDNPIPYIMDNLQNLGLLEELGNKLFYLSRHQKELCISHTDETWKAVKTMLKTIGRSFIIVDTLGSMSRGFDPNSDKDMREVISELKAIRDAGHAVLILHHTQKYASGDESIHAGFKYRGSGVIKSDADGLYFMERDKDGYLLHAGKLRFMGEEKLKVRMTANGLIIEPDYTSKKLKEATELLALMEDGKEYKKTQFVEWAREKLKLGRDRVRELLTFLEVEGLITSRSVKGGIFISKKTTQTTVWKTTKRDDDEDYELPF